MCPLFFQELYDEYFGALQRPGTPLKTFRIKVYVFPALIFETVYEGHETEEMEARCANRAKWSNMPLQRPAFGL